MKDLLYYVILYLAFWTKSHVQTARCNVNNTGDPQNFAYCCCREVNLTVGLFSSNSSVSSNTSVSSNSSISTSNSISTSTALPTTTVVSSIATYYTSISSSFGISTSALTYLVTSTITSSRLTSIVPTVSSTIVGSVSSSIMFTITPDPTGSTKCFYSPLSGKLYRECHCWDYKKNEKTLNITIAGSSKIYQCFNVTKYLYVGGFFDKDSKNHLTLLPAAEMAVADINNRSDILPEYEVVLISNLSTEAMLNTGSKILLDYLYEGPKKVALLGPNSNDIAKSTAAIAGLSRFQILQISYGTDSIDLSNWRDVFPYFFRTKPNPDVLYNKARVELLKVFKWTKVALLYNSSPLYVKLNQQLAELLKQSGISVVAEASFGADPSGAVKVLKGQGAHVILGTFSDSYTNAVFCQAYCNDMWGPHYVWILLGTVSFSATAPCTLQQILCAARTQFFFYRRIEETTSSNTDIGQTPTDFIKKFRSIAGSNTRSETEAKYTYDAMWAIGDILHRAEQAVLPSLSLLNYSYGNNKISIEIKKQTLLTSFYGASDKVEFGQDGNRRMVIDIYQTQLSGSGWSYRGFYDNAAIPSLSIGGLIWTGGEPFRETTIHTTWRHITFGLYIFYCVLAGLGILFALFCLVVILWKRKTRRIYYSCVPVGVVIIVGCILLYVTVFLFGVDETIFPIEVVDDICKARLWVFCLGAAFIAGGLIGKLYVAYNVLAKRILWKKRRRMISMLCIVAVVFFVTLIILVCWHIFDPHMRTVKYIREQINYLCSTEVLAESPFIIKQTAIGQCTCENSLLWYPLVIVWAMVLIVSGCFLAYQTRSVYISALNDTQRCGICMYIAATGCILAVAIGLFTRVYPDIFFGLVGGIILVVVTAVLIILFLNKVLEAFTCSSRCFSLCQNGSEKGTSYGRYGSNHFPCCHSCLRRFCPCCLGCCLCLCAPFLACLGKLFGCCGSCCCGSGDTNGSSKGQQKFIINGVGNDRDAELARLKRELDMKEKYIRRLRGQSKTYTLPAATQTRGNFGNDHSNGNKKVISEKQDYSHVKSKVDSGLNNKTPYDDECDVDRLKLMLHERDNELKELRGKKNKDEEHEMKSLDEKPVSTSKIRISVQNDDAREADELIRDIDDSSQGRDDTIRQGHHGGRRGSNIKIFSEKQDWSHVRSKLKATGAISSKVGKESEPNDIVVVNGPVDNKCKRVSSFSTLPRRDAVPPVEEWENGVNPSPENRRKSAPILLVPSSLTPVNTLSPLTEKHGEDKLVDDPPQNSVSGKKKSKLDSPRSEKGLRIVNGPSDLDNVRPKSEISNISPGRESQDSRKHQDKGLEVPNVSNRRGSNVKIFNDPKDYSHIKSKLATTASVPKENSSPNKGPPRIINNPQSYASPKKPN